MLVMVQEQWQCRRDRACFHSVKVIVGGVAYDESSRIQCCVRLGAPGSVLFVILVAKTLTLGMVG